MRTDMVPTVVRSGGMVLMLALGMMAITLSAQEPPTKEACQRRINSFISSNSLRINPPARARAVEDRQARNMDRARAFLKGHHAERVAQDAKQCLQTMDAFVRKAQLSPAASTMAQARQRCAAGDLQGAIGTIKSNPGPRPQKPQPQPGAEAAFKLRQCLGDLDVFIRRAGRRPDSATYERATAHCHAGGDGYDAIDIIKNGTELPPPPPTPLTPAQCLRNLEIYVQRTGSSPDEATYAAAKVHCESGDIRRATETIRNGVKPQ